MEPVVFTTFVAARGCIPHLVIDFDQSAPANLSGQADTPLSEIELSDADVLTLIKTYRLPTADLNRWAF